MIPTTIEATPAKLLNMHHQDIIDKSLDEKQIQDNSDQYFPPVAEDVEYLQQPTTAAWKQSNIQPKVIPSPKTISHQTVTTNKSQNRNKMINGQESATNILLISRDKQSSQKETSSGSITNIVSIENTIEGISETNRAGFNPED